MAAQARAKPNGKINWSETKEQLANSFTKVLARN